MDRISLEVGREAVNLLRQLSMPVLVLRKAQRVRLILQMAQSMEHVARRQIQVNWRVCLQMELHN